MTKIKFKRPAGSLFLTLAIVFVIGFLLAAAGFLAVRLGFESYIEKTYLSEENKEARELSYVKDLQSYIIENGIESTDPKLFSEWVKMQKYVYLMIYKDDELFFSSDMEFEDNEKNPGGDGEDPREDEEVIPDDGKGEVPEGEVQEPPSTPGSGITVDMPTYEELKEYAAKNDLHPINVADGVLFASIADFTEYLYYDVSNILSLIAAMVGFAVVFIIFFSRILGRVTRLAADVNRVAEGDMTYSIRSRGSDEISRLSSQVENMRSSILENLEREREVRAANEELITSMSHDIRTPLTVLLGYIDVMKMHPHDEAMGEYIKATEATALRLKKLSDDMFGYFLVFGDRAIEANIQDYDGRTLLSQMLDEHILLLNENGYTVSYEECRELEGVGIMTDAPKAMRLIDNVFSNLHKYSDPERPINVGVCIERARVLLTVENGIATDSRAAESNGIGLKTCVKLAELLDIGFEYERQKDSFRCVIAFPTEREILA